ncbi:alkanesulfonate monooxygenase [Kineosphaera limosa]|uniref:Alkanesulfonate monooxygenase n=1 Tax=Kineosphaera limosa NBRC 100340 TaxID=1184609 RepID=K6XDD4_9MICO|nr:LLM class flavin-dependent oxidoreductase [Kineosphaera limosa]NYE00716.1 alkanesulfonate monooxygenase [Kineosphaera limosa]GAB96804.1 alkanesulfonate monooxygenase [Kineosphaera limosa NBRC 100340]
MPITVHWFLTTSGDGRSVVGAYHGAKAQAASPAGLRAPDIDYLALQAQAADRLGFTGVLTPTGTWCEDAWLTTAALARQTQRLKFLVAFRPGLINPTLAAQMTATLQRQTGGRVLLNVVTGGEPAEQARCGDTLPKDRRYARTAEFLQVVKGAWTAPEAGPFDFDGEFYQVRGATVSAAPDPVPDLYFGGSSDAALPVAAEHVDVYLTWGEPPAQVAQKIARVRELADRAGRSLRFGIRLHTISRDSSHEAWGEAQRFLDALDPATVQRAQAALRTSESEGQRRMLALNRGSTDDLVVAPNLWAGVGLVRGGAGTALVGSHEEVADRIAEYHDLGIDEFIFSGYPNLEESFWFGENVVPILRSRGLLRTDAPEADGVRPVGGRVVVSTSPFGHDVATPAGAAAAVDVPTAATAAVS